MPWRYWRISTTRSSSVTATTLTQGAYSLTQYSGMTVPFGSSTRSTRTVYQGFLARYSRVSTFQRPGSSGSLPSDRRHLGVFDEGAGAREHGAHHGRGQLAGVGILSARVVAAEQRGQAAAESSLAAVAERGPRARPQAVLGRQIGQVGVVPDLAQRHHHAQAGEGGDLGGQVAAAAHDLVGGRLVVGGRAADRREHVGVAEGQAV